MSELTEHGRKALERCIREHQKFIELADDYDLDEMSVQALKTAIESMQMRLDANAKPAAGPSEHDESWAEMMEHDYDTAVRGAVISNTVEFTDSCGCVFCDLKCHHSIEDCKLIALLEDVAVQHEGLENYGDSCGPSMCIRACRGAIAALKATHPQPVTPAGGEVPAWHAFPDELSSSDTVTMYRAPCESMCLLTGRTQSTVPVITHPPVADAALDDARFAWLGQQMRSCTTYMDGSRAFDAGSFAMRKHNLRGRTIREAIDAAMSEDAALNQRGGGA